MIQISFIPLEIRNDQSMNLSSIQPGIPTHIKAITDIWPPHRFLREAPLFYSRQVPNMAFLLISGQILIQRGKSKTEEVVDPLALIGLHHLLQNLPINYTATIQPNSMASLIDKKTYLEVSQLNGNMVNILEKLKLKANDERDSI